MELCTETCDITHSFFCADEVSAIVVDVGYTSCKAGFAGEDNPKAVFPSVWTLPPHTCFCDITLPYPGSFPFPFACGCDVTAMRQAKR